MSERSIFFKIYPSNINCQISIKINGASHNVYYRIKPFQPFLYRYTTFNPLSALARKKQEEGLTSYFSLDLWGELVKNFGGVYNARYLFSFPCSKCYFHLISVSVLNDQILSDKFGFMYTDSFLGSRVIVPKDRIDEI